MVLHRWFYIGGFVNEVSIIGQRAPSSSKKLKCITVLIQKELVSWSFVRLNRTKRTSCLIFNSLSMAVAAILPLRVR